ncbi:MAG: AraC family transcriptional regulator [Oscillospiraceae bacterium]
MRHHLKSKFFKKTMFYYMVMFIIPIIILSFFLSSSLIKENKDEFIKEFKSNAQQLSEVLDSGFYESYLFGNRLMSTSWVQKAYSNSDIITRYFDQTKKQEVVEELILHKISIGIAENIVVVLPKKDIAIDTTAWSDIESSLSRLGFTTLKQQIAILSQIRQSSYSKLYNYESFGITDKSKDDILIMQSIDFLSSPRAVLLLRIKNSFISKIINKVGQKSLLSVKIIQGDEVIYSRTLKEKDNYKENDIYSVALPSDSYYLNYELDYVDDRSMFLQIVIGVLVFLLLTILGTFIAYYLTAISYRPIERFFSKAGIENRSQYNDEFEVIQNLFNEIKNEKESLQKSLQRLQETSENNQLHDMLRGYFDDENVENKLASLKINYSNDDYFKVFSVKINQIENTSSEEDMFNLYLCIQSGLLTQPLSFKIVSINLQNMVIIFQASSKKALLNLNETIELIKRYIRDKENISVDIINGNIHKGYIGISKSYQEAKEEQDNVLMRKSIHINSALLSNIRYYYPTDWEIQLINQLKVGNRETSLKIIDEIQKENMSRELPQNINIKVTMLVFDTLIRVADELNMNIQNLTSIYESSVIEDNAENQWSSLKDILIEITQSNQGDSSNEDNSAQIIEYVRDNFADYNLSLKSLGKRFDMSISAVSRVFKGSAKINFSDYLCKIRMEKSKEYMKENNYSMDEISKLVGYDNVLSFKRAFMRCEGIKPTEYKKNCRVR